MKADRGAKAISRAKFLAYAYHKALDSTLKSAARMLSFLEEDSTSGESVEWRTVGKARDIGPEPRLLSSGGKPIILAGSEKDIVAFPGDCPNDGFPLQYLPGNGELFCTCCTTGYSLEGRNLTSPAGKSLLPLKVKVVDEDIRVAVVSSLSAKS